MSDSEPRWDGYNWVTDAPKRNAPRLGEVITPVPASLGAHYVPPPMRHNISISVNPLSVNTARDGFTSATHGFEGGGTVVGGANEGAGIPVFDSTTSTQSTLFFRTLVAGTGVTLTENSPAVGDILIAAPGAAGTVTGGANEGTGVAILDTGTSTATTLEFRTLTAGSNITITPNTPATGDITIAATGGGSGLPGFAYAANTAAQVVSAAGDVTFNLVAFPNSGITPPTGGATTFTITTTGTYAFDYYVAGTPGDLTPPDQLEFGLMVTGTGIVLGTEYFGGSQTTSLAAGPAGVMVLNGFGIVTLTAGNAITLRNRTKSGTATVTLPTIPVGGESGISASLRLMRLA